MAPQPNRRIVLRSRPAGAPAETDFRLETADLPEPEAGEVHLSTLWLSLDPYMRGRMSDAKSYAAPVPVGGVMPGGTVSRVVASRADGLAPGDIVLGQTGWQEQAVVPAKDLVKLDPGKAPVRTALGVLGMPGMTAYAGLVAIGRPKAGETVVVAAAAGAVGSVVGQVAKALGCRAVGVAGGPAKCAHVVETLGFDACVDHRDPGMAEALARACPDGIDVYFENVGGAVLEAVLPLLNPFARMPVCGTIAHYNDTAPPPGPNRVPELMRAVLTRRLTLRGFIVSDLAEMRGEFLERVGAWVREGRIRYVEDVAEGLDTAPRAFIGMLAGKNLGKQLVRVAPE
jgi:NADPH-dependent curcumin reductase CurA